MKNNDHFITCVTCGAQVDMRDLSQVFSHGMYNKLTGKYECEKTEVEFSSSKKVGDPQQHMKDGTTLDLN